MFHISGQCISVSLSIEDSRVDGIFSHNCQELETPLMSKLPSNLWILMRRCNEYQYTVMNINKVGRARDRDRQWKRPSRVIYDRALRRHAEATQDLNWSKVKALLFNLCFTGRAKKRVNLPEWGAPGWEVPGVDPYVASLRQCSAITVHWISSAVHPTTPISVIHSGRWHCA